MMDESLEDGHQSSPEEEQLEGQLRVKDDKSSHDCQDKQSVVNSENIGAEMSSEKSTTYVSTNLSHSTSESMDIDRPILQLSSETVCTEPSDVEPVIKSTRLIIDSDSDDDVEKDTIQSSESSDRADVDETGGTKVSVKPSRRIFSTIVDSDSDDEEIPSSRLKPSDSPDTDETKIKQKSKTKPLRKRLGSDSDDNENIVNNSETVLKKKSNKFSSIIDSESSEDEASKRVINSTPEDHSSVAEGKKKSKKQKPVKATTHRAAKDEAMKQIHSETQRLVREAAISLPYHRPKQRTLEEFLNRKKITTALPQVSQSRAAKLKMSAAFMSDAIKEKEKEAELFYKSSDSEEESSQPELQKKSISTTCIVPEHISIEETQKLNHNIQNAQNKRQIMQQGTSEIGVPRKLFVGDLDEPLENPPEQDTSMLSVENEKKPKSEYKQGLKEFSYPRKLFDSNSPLENDLFPLQPVLSIPMDENDSKAQDYLDKFDCATQVQTTNGESITSIEDTQKVDNSLSKVPEKSKNSDQRTPMDIAATQSTISPSTFENCPIQETPLFPNKQMAISKLGNLNSDGPSSSIVNEETQGKDCTSSEVDCHIIGLPPPIFDDDGEEMEPSIVPPVSIKKRTLLNLPNLNPKLRGFSGMMIDLTAPIKPRKAAVDGFLDRFLSKHSVASKPTEGHTDVIVMNAEQTPDGVKISKETLPYKSPAIESKDDPELNKPGAKLVRLKEDLKKQMTNKRNEEWKLKEQELINEENDEEDEEEDFFLTKKDKLAMESDASEGESEPEEDDVLIKEKKRPSCAFGDEEAEVSEDEDMSDDEDEEEEEDKKENIEASNSQEKRKFSRIVVDEDSNSREPSPVGERIPENKIIFSRTESDVDIFADDGDLSQSTDQNKTSLSSQFPAKSCSDLKLGPKNKLCIIEDRPVTDEELLALCSGRFSTPGGGTQIENQTKLAGLINSNEKPITESQILSMCSGKFTVTQSQVSISPTDLSNVDESSQDLKLTLDPEDEIEISKSAAGPASSGNTEIKNNTEVEWKSLDIASSSEEESHDKVALNKKKVLKKRKVKQLVLSDDEGAEKDEFSDDEEEEEEIEESEEEKFIDYDSDENEIVVVPRKEIKNVAANFLEQEAELSESEWGSEDEDEKGLDKLEAEEGDAEEIDEAEMRNQLGKMQARQLLDEDQRDVRMLKELLFEDGDLHTDGATRERKFRWKNLDKLGDENVLKPTTDDDDGFLLDPAELESELELRTFRLQREKFMEEKIMSSDSMLLDDSNNQIFKLGMKVLEKTKTSMEFKKTEVSLAGIASRSVTEMMSTPEEPRARILHKALKRGSFLARGDAALARLAAVIKQNDDVSLLPKHSRNFLFTHISPSVENNDQEQEENEENVNKKAQKRKPRPSGTPRMAKRAKIETNQPFGKKLF